MFSRKANRNVCKDCGWRMHTIRNKVKMFWLASAITTFNINYFNAALTGPARYILKFADMRIFAENFLQMIYLEIGGNNVYNW